MFASEGKYLNVGNAIASCKVMAGFRNPESSALKSRTQPKESGIPLKVEIWNSIFTDKKSGIFFVKSRIHYVESRIQDCLGFPYTGQLPSERDQPTFLPGLLYGVFPVPLGQFTSVTYPRRTSGKTHIFALTTWPERLWPCGIIRPRD